VHARAAARFVRVARGVVGVVGVVGARGVPNVDARVAGLVAAVRFARLVAAVRVARLVAAVRVAAASVARLVAAVRVAGLVAAVRVARRVAAVRFARLVAAVRVAAAPIALAALAALAALLAACGMSDLHIAGAPPASQYLVAFDGTPSGASLGEVRFSPDVCDHANLRPVDRPLDVDDFLAFVKAQGLETRVVRARSDLVFVDVLNAGTPAPVRFRVAILDTAGAAGHELHGALLQHGEGSWGLHRGNLAVLAPEAPADDAVVFAAKLHLACWGTLMIAGHDDTYVVPGGYTEL
jgi:hypothetical protein